jgi:hypothetical protein
MEHSIQLAHLQEPPRAIRVRLADRSRTAVTCAAAYPEKNYPPGTPGAPGWIPSVMVRSEQVAPLLWISSQISGGAPSRTPHSARCHSHRQVHQPTLHFCRGFALAHGWVDCDCLTLRRPPQPAQPLTASKVLISPLPERLLHGGIRPASGPLISLPYPTQKLKLTHTTNHCLYCEPSTSLCIDTRTSRCVSGCLILHDPPKVLLCHQ